MPNLPSVAKYITVEETRFRSPVSESMSQKFGQTNNFLLDHYPIQPGTVHVFAGPELNVPPGYIVCDGRAVNRTTYLQLFNAIGVNWGHGDGLTTFNVPDLRGLFLRMINTTTQGPAIWGALDPDANARFNIYPGGQTGNHVGSYEDENLASHDHNIPVQAGGGGQACVQGRVGLASLSGTSTGVTGGGPENRTANALILYIIKY